MYKVFINLKTNNQVIAYSDYPIENITGQTKFLVFRARTDDKKIIVNVDNISYIEFIEVKI